MPNAGTTSAVATDHNHRVAANRATIDVVINSIKKSKRGDTMRTIKRKLKYSNQLKAGILLSAIFATGMPAIAQEGGTGFSIEEVVVTARRREESLQDTPIAVTAVQGDLLEEIGATDITAIANIAPNVSFSTTGTVSGSTSSAVVYIRGVGQNDYVPVVDPGVGIYVDDVYMGRTVGSVLDLMDVKSVEAIRGPQGTLFGRNSVGGAISITTNDPSGETGGKIRAIGGDQGRAEFFGTLDVAFSDTVSGIFNFMSRDRNGTVDRINVDGGEKLGNENSIGGRAKINIDATEKLTLQIAGDYVREREESAPEVNIFFNDTFTLPGAHNGFNGFAAFAPFANSEGCVPGDTTVGTNCYNNSLQEGPFATGETSLSQNDIDTWGVSLVATYDINENLTAKAIVAHRDLDAAFARQVDGSPFNIFENRDTYLADQTSFDFRLNGSYGNVEWVVGAFYFEEEADNQLDFTGVLEGTLYPVHFGGTVDNSNYAFYGEGTWDATDRLHLSAGIRYTDEDKNATPNAFGYPGCAELLGNISEPSADCDSTLAPVDLDRRTINTDQFLIDPVENSISFDQVTWRVVAAYDFGDATSVYASVSTGFKAGGFEWRVTDTNFANDPQFADADLCGEGNECLPSFDPEEVTTYEIGLKTSFSEILTVNAAIFYSDYEDLIIASNPPGSIATFQTNAGQASIQGLEVEAIWVPTPNTLVNFGIGLLDAEYDSLNPGSSVDLDDEFVFTPDTSVTLGISHIFPLRSGAAITARIDGTHKSSQEFEAANTEFTRDNGFVAFDTSIKYGSANENWSLTIGALNVTDELYRVGGDANSAIGYENVIFARDRSFYAALNYEF